MCCQPNDLELYKTITGSDLYASPMHFADYTLMFSDHWTRRAELLLFNRKWNEIYLN